MSAGMNVHVLNVAFCCLLPQGQFRPNQQDVGSGQSRGSAGQDHRGPNQMKRYGFLNRRCPHRKNHKADARIQRGRIIVNHKHKLFCNLI